MSLQGRLFERCVTKRMVETVDRSERLHLVPEAELPLVSIIFVTYNQERFVAEAMRGLLAQTYPRLDILIMDDGSDDATGKTIAGMLATTSNSRADVRLVASPENLGDHGRNNVLKGLSLSRGDFIVMSCGDDVMLPEMVEEMARVWRSENVSLVTANATYIDEHSKSLNRAFRDPSAPADDSFETLVRDGSNACCFGPAIGFEPELYARFGWPPAYLGSYDIMTPFYAYLSKGARFISKPLLQYRVHSQNSSLSLAVEKANSLEKSLIEERMYISHIAHATLMEEEIDRLQNESPSQYGPVATRIKPLIAIQLSEMAKKLARVSRQSGTLAVKSRW